MKRLFDRPGGDRTAASGRDSTRDKILRVALDVFAEYGYDGTSTREICKRAGVNGAALNYHWGSKEQLWQAVANECAQMLMRVVEERVDLSQPAEDVFFQFLDVIFDELLTNPAPARIPLWAALQAESLDFGATASTIEPATQLATGFFRQLQQDGKIGDDVDVELAMPQIYGQLLYLFADQAGHRNLFNTDMSNPEFAARVKKAYLRSARTLLGLPLGSRGDESAAAIVERAKRASTARLPDS